MITPPLLRIITSLLLLTGTGQAQEEPTVGPFSVHAWCKDFSLGSRPWDGKVGDAGCYDLWVQMTGERGAHRIVPTPFSDGKTSSLNASCQPGTGLVSPDARWVALQQKYCTSFAVAYVLQRDQEKGFKPLPKLVSELGWDKFLEGHPKLQEPRQRMDGITHIGSSLCDLVAWEPDASGVWFSLRGGDRRGEGIYQWYFFWDAKTQQAVVPEAVKAINQFASSRWKSDGKTYAGAWAAAEEEHCLFLAELEWRFVRPAEDFETEAQRLRQKWRADSLVAAAELAEKSGEQTNDLMQASKARELIARQREALFRASLRTGTSASLEQP